MIENAELNTDFSSNLPKNCIKKTLNELQDTLSHAIESYKKNGGKPATIKFYDESGRCRRVNTKKKIKTVKKRKFIPYGMEDPDAAKRRKRKRSQNEYTTQDDDGYDFDQLTQSSEKNLSEQLKVEEEEEEEYEESYYQKNSRPRTLREKMDDIALLLNKMQGDLNEVEDYDFSDGLN